MSTKLSENQQCKLCRSTANLKNSHILPEFLYLQMYDDLHRAVWVTSEADEKERFIQKGIREYLLCGDCEQKFSRYERFAAPIIKSIPFRRSDANGLLISIPEVDYAHFKLFQVSLLWRASVSQNPMFDAVQLGQHEETLRQMLLMENPGQPHEYGCVMISIPNPRVLDKIMWSPVRDSIDGHTCFRFLTGSVFWYFFLSSYPGGTSVQRMLMTRDNTLRLVVAPWSEKEIVSRIAGLFADRETRKQTGNGG